MLSIRNLENEAKRTPQKEIPIPAEWGGIDLEGYEPHRGMFPGKHWRKAEGMGCYHYREHENKRWVHYDRFDPRRHPYLHVAETPELRVIFLSAGLGAGMLFAVLREWNRKR